MMQDYIFKSDYKSLVHQELHISDTKEKIFWIIDRHMIFYRCYAFPETINFCYRVLVLFNKNNTIDEVELDSCTAKEKLILLDLQTFIKNNNRIFQSKVID